MAGPARARHETPSSRSWEDVALALDRDEVDEHLFGAAASDETFNSTEATATPPATLGRPRPSFRVVEGGISHNNQESELLETDSVIGSGVLAIDDRESKEVQETTNEVWTLERAQTRAEQIKNAVEAKIPNLLSVLQTEHGPDFLNAHAAASDLDTSMSPEVLKTRIETFEAVARRLGVPLSDETDTRVVTEEKNNIDTKEREEKVSEEALAVDKNATPNEVYAFPGRADGPSEITENDISASSVLEDSESYIEKVKKLAEGNGLVEGTDISLEEIVKEVTKATAPHLDDAEIIVALWDAREKLEASTLDQEGGNPTQIKQDVDAGATTHSEIENAVREDRERKEKGTVLTNETPNLMSPEVTAGLERLLKEWPYFKGSGMLGFGPGGLEHPTFKKLSNVPVRYVLTGRFDDPDQGLIAEIREYVGGWRREQNVEPQENETFEQYLRRVIAKILDTQAAIDTRTNIGA